MGGALLALAGPIGWSVAGRRSSRRSCSSRRRSPRHGKRSTRRCSRFARTLRAVRSRQTQIRALLERSTSVRELLRDNYTQSLAAFGQDFPGSPRRIRRVLRHGQLSVLLRGPSSGRASCRRPRVTDPISGAKRTRSRLSLPGLNHLNEVRLETLFARLERHADDLDGALSLVDARAPQDRPRGRRPEPRRSEGMHGFIAEVAEVGVGNARARIVGEAARYGWVNDNGPVDLLRDGVEIQQKFVAAGGRLGRGRSASTSTSIRTSSGTVESTRSPRTIRDHPRLHAMSATDARASSSRGPVTARRTGLASRPSVLRYRTSRRGLPRAICARLRGRPTRLVHGPLESEKDSLRATARSQRAGASAAGRASIREAGKATIAAGAVEGVTTFVTAVVRKHRAGTPLAQFTDGDWTEGPRRIGSGRREGWRSRRECLP